MRFSPRSHLAAPALLSLTLLAACGRTSFAVYRNSEPASADEDAGPIPGLPLGSSCTEDPQCAATLFCDRLCGPYGDPYEAGIQTYFATHGVCAPLSQAPDCDTTCADPNDCCDVTHHCRPNPDCNFSKVFRTDCDPVR